MFASSNRIRVAACLAAIFACQWAVPVLASPTPVDATVAQHDPRLVGLINPSILVTPLLTVTITTVHIPTFTPIV
ncbi:hypothetical protein CC1G_02191 [Coprinopsis cinerea okayama7|uniref:Uncharacterized protein n=1 Tax=Coprinopsis cinerea (strain Okayama-7 / 130 / ATCC MYA-4618 / FGSC 9003) TaxID=240176 RepID=A8NKH9_COPC7|nr:hypothetical protein CC1G_02191 [Coprinopsis cinerea okayama7\|eukprot:XP_001834455.1 hypothetical protein CC1G_02191 [Coprinopsis cinerea okayama7\